MMIKKIYDAPSAEVIYLVPQEEITATWKWSWDTFKGETASFTGTKIDIWDAYDGGDDSSYKYD